MTSAHYHELALVAAKAGGLRESQAAGLELLFEIVAQDAVKRYRRAAIPSRIAPADTRSAIGPEKIERQP